MKSERIKTTVLVLLILTSLILTVNKWFSEKLWPDGYNFFSNLSSYFSFGNRAEKKTYFLSKENISNPAKIVLNNGEMRGVYTHTSENYNEILPLIKDYIRQGLASGSFEAVDETAWKDALKGKSAYVSYPVSYDVATFGAIVDTKVSDFGILSVKEFVIYADDVLTGKPHLIIKNESGLGYADVAIPTDTIEFGNLVEHYAKSSVGEYPYSFELNFDKSNNTVEQKIIIEPQVLLPINASAGSTISKINYFENILENRSLYTSFLKNFGYNTTNIQKYADISNSLVFVENYGSIKMHNDGLLEYRALDNSKGIELKSSGKSEKFYDNFIDCIEFVNKVWDTACADCNMNINISSITMGDAPNNFRLTIDYYADGMEIVSSIPRTNFHEKLNHAIEIEVKNSKIVSYRQIVVGFVANNAQAEHINVIEALDRLMASDTIKSDTITELYLAYTPSETNGNEYVPCWVAKTAQNEIRTIKN